MYIYVYIQTNFCVGARKYIKCTELFGFVHERKVAYGSHIDIMGRRRMAARPFDKIGFVLLSVRVRVKYLLFF